MSCLFLRLKILACRHVVLLSESNMDDKVLPSLHKHELYPMHLGLQRILEEVALQPTRCHWHVHLLLLGLLEASSRSSSVISSLVG